MFRDIGKSTVTGIQSGFRPGPGPRLSQPSYACMCVTNIDVQHAERQSPVRSNSGPMPTASSHASRSSFNQMKLEIIKRMQKVDKTKSDVRSAVCAPIFLFFFFSCQ